jgi:hypothetical protein
MSVHANHTISNEAQELALTIINDGCGYADRCKAAREPTPYGRASAWARIAGSGARAYDREWANPGESLFGAGDILGAAMELDVYYAQHIAETDALREEG